MSLPLNIDFQQILLHMLNLVLLFGGLYLLLYKPVKKFMDDRAAKYKDIDDEANKKLAEATAAREQAQTKLAAADSEISAKLAQAKLDAEREAESIIEDAKKAKKKLLSDAEDAALREKNRLINDAREEIAELAVKAAEKVLMEKTSKAGKKNA